MGKAKMLGAFAPYTPNSRADMRYRRKAFERQRNATPKGQRKLEKQKEAMYGC